MSRSIEGPNIEVVCMGMGLENEKIVVSGHGKAPKNVELIISKPVDSKVMQDGTLIEENGKIVTNNKINYQNIIENRKARGKGEKEQEVER